MNKNEFDWQFEDSHEVRTAGHTPLLEAYWWWLAALLAVGAILSLWLYLEHRLEQEQIALRQYLQRQISLQHRAFVVGDGELFYDSLTNSPPLRAAQLWPINREAWQAGLTVTAVEQIGQSLAVVNAEWTTAEGQTYQRLLFYEQTPVGLRQRASPTAFWGTPTTSTTPWGTLTLYEVDEVWRDDFARQISTTADYLCGTTCPPLNVIIAPDFGDTAAPQTILSPSPRLIALDSDGQPSLLYWQLLLTQLKAYYAPAPLRFAVPSAQLSAYTELAKLFAEQNPLRPLIVEIVPLESLPPEPADWVGLVDGAAVAPSEAMLAAGLVRDLTDYVNSDPAFDASDFYEQIWLAGWWRGRMWFLPQTAEMPIIYYDPVAYRDLGRAVPTAGWTWAQLQADSAALAAGPSGWGMADPNQNLLLAYAYHQGQTCPDTPTVRCTMRLREGEATAALAFYQQMASQMPHMAPLNPIERENWLLTLTSPSSNGVSLWVSKPVEYENHFQQRSAGVVAFPGSAEFGGVTPLWVQGNFISATSGQPLEMWAWLRFLSDHYPVRTARLIPSRPSVATRTGFWASLPDPLEEAMRAGFPFARPILIEEQSYFLPEQLEAIYQNERTPAEGVNLLRPRVRWFGQ